MTSDEYVAMFAQRGTKKAIRIILNDIKFEPKIIAGISIRQPSLFELNPNLAEEINEWYAENSFGQYARLYPMFEWVFDHENDAAIFKLKWG